MSATSSTSPKVGNIVHRDYQGAAVGFTGDGWFNATDAAARFERRPTDWLKLDSTQEYLTALSEQFGEVRKFHFTKRGSAKGSQGGGGETWMHPKLAVVFARWLDVRFAVWCDAQIDSLIRGRPQDWRKLRQEAASGYKVVSAVLHLTRQEAGKVTEPYHYANEARLINGMLAGRFAALDRKNLSGDEMALLVELEAKDAVLLARGAIYQDRKLALERCATDWRIARSRALVAA